MNIFTESEIDRISESFSNFRKKWHERRLQKVDENKKIANKKRHSQRKNWSKWKKRK
ncbi:hypothetical protein [Alkalihalobacterium alkalinitrilicum]|uniref:hypothetical protein n=1 Tax=Alkalihalobacterium alkalinitrilicum TaxID=427920 RepID=UPI001303698D|nr:hypothetical protein [Alkalihalobacterium alkalinitrilicum]